MDVSSRWLDASFGRAGTPERFANTPSGIAQLASRCLADQFELVAMEATGGYERQVFALLSERGLPVAILNPCAVRQFGRMHPRDQAIRYKPGERRGKERTQS